MRRFGQGMEKVVWPALAFFLGILLRAIPEALLPGIPVGFDTISYIAPTVHIWLTDGINWTYAFQEGPIVYLLAYLPSALGADILLVLKVLGPIIYGFFAVTIILFLREINGQSWSLSFFGSTFAVFQLANLRMGWDLWRNLLGFAFVLLTFVFWVSKSGRFALHGTVGLSLLTVLTNQFAAATLFVAAGIALFLGSMKGRRVAIAAALIPSFALFVADLYVVVFVGVSIRQNVVLLLQTRAELANYVNEFGSVMSFWSAVSSFASFALWVLPILTIIGLNRERALAGLGLGTFAFLAWSLGFPSDGLPQWWRWVLALGVPLSIYGFIGLLRIANFAAGALSRIGSLRRLKHIIRIAVVLILIVPFGLVATAYISNQPHESLRSFVSSKWNVYFPATLVGTSVTSTDVPPTLEAMQWLSTHAPADAVVLVEERFMGWALLELPNNLLIVVFPVQWSPTEALDVVSSQAAGRQVFLVWLSGHYVTGFNEIQKFGNIAVFLRQT